MANSKSVSEIRIASIKAAIWPNDTEGRTRYTVTFSRLYKDAEQWKTTPDLRPQRPVGPGESGRSGALADLRNSAGRRRPGGVTGVAERRSV